MYRATCKLFPGCKGIGATKQEALNKLARSISIMVSKMIKTTLTDTFNSKHYTEVLFDQTQEPNQQSMVFNLNKENNVFPTSFLFRLSSFANSDDEDLYADHNQSLSNDMTEDDIDTYEFKYSPSKGDIAGDMIENDIYDQFLHQNKSNNDPDSYVFGFPLSFN